jgi:uncharacterized Zn-binding protein involved in type VI secretion
MPLIIRLGDTSTHGGAMVTSARKSMAEGKLICRVGDTLNCPIHGPNPVVEGSPNSLCEGPKVARQGDHTACGAALISGATKTVVNS